MFLSRRSQVLVERLSKRGNVLSEMPRATPCVHEVAARRDSKSIRLLSTMALRLPRCAFERDLVQQLLACKEITHQAGY
jgi:hypothetical protein